MATRLVSDSSRGFAARVASASLAFAFNVYVARTLGVEGAGLFFLSVSVVTSLAVVSRFGADAVILRITAQQADQNNWVVVKAIYRDSALLIAMIATLISALLYANAEIIALQVFEKEGLAQPLRYMSIAIAPLALTALYSQLLRGIHMIGSSLFAQSAMVPMLTLLLAATLSYSTVQDVAAAYFIAAVTALVLLSVLWLRHAPILGIKAAKSQFGRLLSGGRRLFLASIMDHVVQPWAAILFLGIWASATEVGWFAAANRVASLVAFAVLPVVASFSPKAAILSEQRNFVGLGDLTHKATTLIAIFAIPILTLCLIFSDAVMSIYGDDFRAASQLLMILLIGQGVNAATGPARAILLMSGHDSDYRTASFFGGALNLVTCAVLIPEMGAMGAAWATVAGLASINLYSAIMVWVRMGIAPLNLMQR